MNERIRELPSATYVVERVDGTAPSSQERRALLSAGISCSPIYNAARRVLDQRRRGRCEILVDLGCGTGALWNYVHDKCERYVGIDIIRYESLPPQVEFVKGDLETSCASIPDGFADVVLSLEVIEHVENPRAFVREASRICKPGGLLMISTPNQLSLLSKLTLLLFNEFNAFRATSYPAHITALLEVDLARIATEQGCVDIEFAYSQRGRIPGTSFCWPSLVSRIVPRLFSDNVLLVAKRPMLK